MNKSLSDTLFSALDELRILRTVDRVPVVSALLLLHTVDYFEDHFAALKVHLPATAVDLTALQLPLTQVYEALAVVLAGRLKMDFSSLVVPDIDDALTARISRKVGAFVLQMSTGKSAQEALMGIGADFTHFLDYTVRQFPVASGLIQTPESLAKLLAKVLDAQPGMRILDPTCGLARVLVEVERDQVRQGHEPDGLIYRGQEVNPDTALLGAIHLLLNGVSRFRIRVEGTLMHSTTKLEWFDRVVGDPPMGLPVADWTGELQGDPRFVFGGVSLPKTGDWLFLQHGLTALRPGGRAIFITAHGPLFRGGIEAAIRRDVLAAGWVNTVLALPSALYPNMALPLVLTIFERPETGSRGRQDVLMIDASGWGTREGRTQVLSDSVQKYLGSLIADRDLSEYDEPPAALIPASRIFENKDAWQPNQYLEINTVEPRDLNAIHQDLLEQIKRVRRAEDYLDDAFNDLN